MDTRHSFALRFVLYAARPIWPRRPVRPGPLDPASLPVATNEVGGVSERNAMTYEGKDTILRVVREQAEQLFAFAEQPDAWDAKTACESWEVSDVIGHLV